MRLAGVSALLTFVILCAFALAIGSLTVERIRSDFNRQVEDTAEQLVSTLDITVYPLKVIPQLSDFANKDDHAAIRILTLDGTVIDQSPANAPPFGAPSETERTVNGYRVVSRPAVVHLIEGGARRGEVVIEYGHRVSDTRRPSSASSYSSYWAYLPGACSRCSPAWRSPAARWRRSRCSPRRLRRSHAPATPQAACRNPRPMTRCRGPLARTLEGMLRELDRRP